jgi:hypothetical protein
MVSLFLSVVPLASILAVLAYALASGLRIYRASGQVATLGVAITISGLTLGRLLDRLPLPREVDDWMNSGGAHFLGLMRVEVALLFLLAAAMGLLVITLLRRDAEGQVHPETRSRQLPLLGMLFVLAVGIAARSKVAALLALLLEKGHLI